jgi:hypothetical protein
MVRLAVRQVPTQYLHPLVDRLAQARGLDHGLEHPDTAAADCLRST